MYEWHMQIQKFIDEIDNSILRHDDASLTLFHLSRNLGYSKFHTTRKFKEISGMQFREYVRLRKLAFALKEVRDSEKKILEIALNYGFSSHEAFTRAFKKTYGITPSKYRKEPTPIILRSKLTSFDRFLFGLDEIGMMKSIEDIKTYFVTIPAHKFLHIKNYESNGYWDFWEKQRQIQGQDYDTICGLLDSIKGKLDDSGGSEVNSGSGQIMAYMSNPKGRLCDWNFPRTECYGVRLPIHYQGEVPPTMCMVDVPEAEYLVFEHGPFDYEQEKRSVEDMVEKAMATFDFSNTGYRYDSSYDRLIYFYFNPKRFWKYVRAVCKV